MILKQQTNNKSQCSYKYVNKGLNTEFDNDY